MEIVIKNLKKQYEETEILKGINLQYNGCGLICIVGPSGSGKSTLLNLLGGLDTPQSGEIFFNGINITKLNKTELTNFRSQSLGFIFQDYHLLSQLTVSENISISNYINGVNHKSDVNNLIDQLGLSKHANQKINLLSGGEKQRVAIARALLNQPELILADEPTGNLDIEHSEMIFQLLKEIAKDHLVVITTHNIGLAEKYSDKIYTIHDGFLKNQDEVTFPFQEKYFEIKKHSFYKRGLLTLSIRNMFNHKWRLFTTILSLFIMLLCINLLLSLRFGFKDAVQTIYKHQFDADILTVNKNISYDQLLGISTGYLQDDDLELINKLDNISFVLPSYNALNVAVDGIHSEGNVRIIDNTKYFKDEIEPYLIGKFPENKDEIIMSMKTAQKYYPDNYKNIIGQDVTVNMNGIIQKVTVSGINKVNTDSYYYLFNSLVDELKEKANQSNRNLANVNFINKENYENKNKTASFSKIKNANEVNNLDLLYGRNIQSDNEILISSQAFYQGINNFTNDLFTLADLTHKEMDETIIDHYLSNGQYIYPSEFGLGGKELVKVVGIYKSTDNEIIASDHLYNKMTEIYPSSIDVYIKDISKYKKTMGAFENLGFNVYSNYEAQLENVKTSIHEFTLLFMILTGITTSLSFLLLYILISNQINSRTKELGILKALGTKSKDIVFMLTAEGVIIGILSSLLVFILSYIITPKLNLLMNQFVYNINYENIHFLKNNILSLLGVLLIGIIFTAIVTLLPGRRAAKLNPIDAINRG